MNTHSQTTEEEGMDNRKFTTAFIIVWCIGAMVSLGLAGAMIWAIIKLVSHFT